VAEAWGKPGYDGKGIDGAAVCLQLATIGPLAPGRLPGYPFGGNFPFLSSFPEVLA